MDQNGSYFVSGLYVAVVARFSLGMQVLGGGRSLGGRSRRWLARGTKSLGSRTYVCRIIVDWCRYALGISLRLQKFIVNKLRYLAK